MSDLVATEKEIKHNLICTVHLSKLGTFAARCWEGDTRNEI